MADENQIIPRICVCKTIPDCLTAINVDTRLARCLDNNVYIPSHHTLKNEAYPVLVLEFPDDITVYTPSDLDVPDVAMSHERWILHKISPVRTTLRWIAFDSILVENPHDYPDELAAISCKFVSNLGKYNHPWLNGRGHVLSSPFPDTQYEDYSKLPIGQCLGVIKTTNAILQSIQDIMSWKPISGKHKIKLESEHIPRTGANSNIPMQLIIDCNIEASEAPTLTLALQQGERQLAVSDNFTDLDELERIGITFRNRVYRPRIDVCKDDGTTGVIAGETNTAPTKEELDQIEAFTKQSQKSAQELINDPEFN